MTAEDFKALLELVKEMTSLAGAVKFIRAETGYDLRTSMNIVENIASENPESPLGLTYQANCPPQSPSPVTKAV